jgi:hypothetical protein
VIVVVEGPSAAGKTTWCRLHAGNVIPEYAADRAEPTDPDALARHWVAVGAGRWAEALAAERARGLAVCDTDPVKLHYTWGNVMLGRTPRGEFERELAATREAFVAGSLGFADLVLVGLPDVDALRRQRAGDPTRRRRNFEAHALLREPLRQWYAALDALDPGRVRWELPAEGLPDPLPAPRSARTAVHLLDALTATLPTP